jgi:hypothetical protein
MNRIIVLEDPFDPYELPPGYYTAYSDTPAYPTLWAMVNVGMAQDEGARYLKGGVVQRMASFQMPPLERNPNDKEFEEAMVVIPHSSFTKVVNDYGEWRQMWWREVIQNSIDANATDIDCRVQEQEDGTWLVSCQDNGVGMSYEILMNAFFTVGGTDKPLGARGGFGEAKKLIALAWVQYRVHTRDILVEGTGAEFPKLRVYRDVENIQGTKVEVVMPADKHTTEAAAIEYISRCQLPGVRFFVNGTPVKANLRRGRKKRDMPMGAELFYNKDVEGIHALLVRSNGLYMFGKDLSSDFEGIIVLEVHPKHKDQGGPTVEKLFMSNRMGLQYGNLRDALDRVYTQAEFDIKQALRSPDSLFRKRYEGRGFFTTETARNREAVVREAAGPLPEIDGGGGLEMTGDMLRALVEQFMNFETMSVEEAAGDATRLVGVMSAEESEIMLGTQFKGESHLESSIKQMVWQPNFININDETTREGFKLDKKFDPAFMTGPVYALARLWSAFIRFILVKQGSSETWGVGFVFSTEGQGMFYRDDNGEQWVCLNPINLSTGKLMNIRDKNDLRLIFEVAMHECSHLLGGAYHGDAFVKAFDSVVTEVIQHWNEAKRLAKGIKVRGFIKKMKYSSVPEEVEMAVTPIADKLVHFSVVDDPSIKALMEGLNLNGRDLEFYLSNDELEDRFINKAPREEVDKYFRGQTFLMKRSYPWVRRELKAANERPVDYVDEPSYEIPVRLTATHGGMVYAEPDSKPDRWWFSQFFRGISDASLRVPIARSSYDVADMIERWFFHNRLLGGWPYTGSPQGAGLLVKKLFREGQVVIPIDRHDYMNVLRAHVEDSPSNVMKADKIPINVNRDARGYYLVHPSNEWEYNFYKDRFDANVFEMKLDKGRESLKLEEHLADWNKSIIDEGQPTTVFVPLELFDLWVYNHEYKIRRADWDPRMTDRLQTLAQDTVTVLARNLGPNLIVFEFSSPSAQGDAITNRYFNVTPSDLMWFMLADKMSDLLSKLTVDVESGKMGQRHLLQSFWKSCSPGTMIVEMPASVFIAGVGPQFELSHLEPVASCPVWLFFSDNVLTITPVLEANKRWFQKEMYKEGFAVVGDIRRAETIARQLLQSTYNCGATPAGLSIAENEYDKLVKERKPVLAAILTSDFIDLIMEHG